MSNEPLDPRLQEQIRDLQPPLPDPSFRERNRKLFTGMVRYDADEDRRFQPSRPRGWLWSGVGVAAAAAAAVLLLVGLPAPSWEIYEAPAGGPVLINGEEVATDDAAGMVLTGSSRVRGSALGLVTLGIDGAVSLVLAPGTEVSVDASRSLWGGTTLYADVQHGTAWGATGPDFPENGLWIETDHARVHVSGTTFSVQSESDSTCICVLSGDVDVECKITGAFLEVAPDQQLYLSPYGGGTRRFSVLRSEQRQHLTEVQNRTAKSF